MRSYIRGFLAFLCVLGLSSLAACQLHYRLVRLPNFLHATYAEAKGINNYGDVVGYDNVDPGQRGFVYHNGILTPLVTSHALDSNAGVAINDSGLIVGYVWHAYQNGTLWDISGNNLPFEYLNDEILDVNSQGHYLGLQRLWSGSEVFDLPGTAFAVNDLDEVAGVTSHQAYLWIQGTTTVLPLLSSYDQGAVHDMNDFHDVVGVSTRTQGGSLNRNRATLWHEGQAINLGYLFDPSQGENSEAWAINNAGQIVGEVRRNSNTIRDAFLYYNGTMIGIDSLIDNLGADHIFKAQAINENGWIAVQYKSPQNSQFAGIVMPYYDVAPDSYSIFRGSYVSGTLESLSAGDDDYLAVSTNPLSSSRFDPPVSVIILGTSPIAGPHDVRVQLEAHTNVAGLSETVEFWDYQASQWVTLSTTNATQTDSLVTAIGYNSARFVEPITMQVKARISWRPIGAFIRSWTVALDQANWTVSP